MMNRNENTTNNGSNNNLLGYQLAQLIASGAIGGSSTGSVAAAPSTTASAAAAAAAADSATTEAQTLLALLQQRQQTTQPAASQPPQAQRPSFAEATAVATLDRESNARAQALLRHHEERLRATRLLLEQQEQQGNVQQHPLLMASNAMAAARAAQDSILGGMSSTAAATTAPGGGSGGTAASALVFPTPSADTSGDEKLAQMLAAQEALTETGQIEDEDLNGAAATAAAAAAAAAAEKEGPAEDEKVPAESDDEKDAPEPEMDDDEGYDDKMTDDEYFENFTASDDNRVIQETFPLKLYRMLHEVEKNGKQNIVSFMPHGKSFVVHKPKAFVEEVMPKYFTTCRLASFQRQLNLYGFRRITEGREKGAYSHDCFLKGKRAFCRKVKRQKTRVKASQHHTLGAWSSLAVPAQPFLGLGGATGYSRLAAAAASAPNLGTLLPLPSAHGLTNSASAALLGRLSGTSLVPARPAGIGGDLGYNLLQEALRRGLLTDVNTARQQSNTTATSPATQELQKRLQEQEAELILQRLQQQQQQQPQQQQDPQQRRLSDHENQRR